MTLTPATPPAGIEHLPDENQAWEIGRGVHGDPFSVLGRFATDGGAIVRVYRPGAHSATVIDGADKEIAVLEAFGPDGFFSGYVPGLDGASAYRMRYSHGGGTPWDEEDPYRFGPILGEQDVYLLAEGNHYRMYEKLGAHPTTMEGVEGTAFAVWAPGARRVSVVGYFNSWDGRRSVIR